MIVLLIFSWKSSSLQASQLHRATLSLVLQLIGGSICGCSLSLDRTAVCCLSNIKRDTAAPPLSLCSFSHEQESTCIDLLYYSKSMHVLIRFVISPIDWSRKVGWGTWLGITICFLSTKSSSSSDHSQMPKNELLFKKLLSCNLSIVIA